MPTGRLSSHEFLAGKDLWKSLWIPSSWMIANAKSGLLWLCPAEIWTPSKDGGSPNPFGDLPQGCIFSPWWNFSQHPKPQFTIFVPPPRRVWLCHLFSCPSRDWWLLSHLPPGHASTLLLAQKMWHFTKESPRGSCWRVVSTLSTSQRKSIWQYLQTSHVTSMPVGVLHNHVLWVRVPRARFSARNL